jgi:hypothetical protein
MCGWKVDLSVPQLKPGANAARTVSRSRSPVTGLIRRNPACLSPGKRPRSTLSPTMALRDGEPYLRPRSPNSVSVSGRVLRCSQWMRSILAVGISGIQQLGADFYVEPLNVWGTLVGVAVRARA